MIIIISAMSYDRVIGSGAGMPWHVPEEYAQFLQFVEGNAVIMGSRSFEIFGKDLTKTRNFVVSRRLDSVENGEICRSLEAAIEAAAQFSGDIYIAGGGQIYSLGIPLADRMYLSYIKGEFTGDTYFPDFDVKDWQVVEQADHAAFKFIHYKRA